MYNKYQIFPSLTIFCEDKLLKFQFILFENDIFEALHSVISAH